MTKKVRLELDGETSHFEKRKIGNFMLFAFAMINQKGWYRGREMFQGYIGTLTRYATANRRIKNSWSLLLWDTPHILILRDVVKE